MRQTPIRLVIIRVPVPIFCYGHACCVNMHGGCRILVQNYTIVTFSEHHLEGGKEEESLWAYINLRPFGNNFLINNIHGSLTICPP